MECFLFYWNSFYRFTLDEIKECIVFFWDTRYIKNWSDKAIKTDAKRNELKALELMQ